MRQTLLVLASIAAAGFLSAPAQAQWQNYGYTTGDGVIRCESRDGRVERCPTNGGNAQIVRQISSNTCVRGRTWGTDSQGIWVGSGCRAEFRVDDDRGYDGDRYGGNYGGNYGGGYYADNDGLVRCESKDNRTVRCGSSGGNARLVRQLSDTACVRGRTWGSDSRGIWVSGGCRALFQSDNRRGGGYDGGGRPGGNDLVRCESKDNRSQTCAISTGRGGDVRMVRQLSDKPCVEGQTWGQSRNGVWVTRGCRAEFVSGRR